MDSPSDLSYGSFDSCSLRVLSSRVRSVPWGNANWIEIRLSKPFLVRSSYLYIFLWLVMRAGPFLFTKWSPCLILWDFVDSLWMSSKVGGSSSLPLPDFSRKGWKKRNLSKESRGYRGRCKDNKQGALAGSGLLRVTIKNHYPPLLLKTENLPDWERDEIARP